MAGGSHSLSGCARSAPAGQGAAAYREDGCMLLYCTWFYCTARPNASGIACLTELLHVFRYTALDTRLLCQAHVSAQLLQPLHMCTASTPAHTPCASWHAALRSAALAVPAVHPVPPAAPLSPHAAQQAPPPTQPGMAAAAVGSTAAHTATADPSARWPKERRAWPQRMLLVARSAGALRNSCLPIHTALITAMP
jgi:hypothetical protein